MTGYESKRAAAQDKLITVKEHGATKYAHLLMVKCFTEEYDKHRRTTMDDDDDTQVYQDHDDALTIAYQSGYYDGKKAAQPSQEPVATDWNAVHEKLCEVWNRQISADEGLDEIQDLINTTPAQPAQEPVSKLQEPTAERAWFTIAELNAWADKKLSENPHWVMPKDEPERDEPPPQRPWVGLMRGARVEGDTVVIKVQSNNEARLLCSELVNEMGKNT